MAVIELLYRIEETFDLQIPDQDLAGMTTVGHVVNYVEKRLGNTTSPALTKKPNRRSQRAKGNPNPYGNASTHSYLIGTDPQGSRRRTCGVATRYRHKPSRFSGGRPKRSDLRHRGSDA